MTSNATSSWLLNLSTRILCETGLKSAGRITRCWARRGLCGSIVLSAGMPYTTWAQYEAGAETEQGQADIEEIVVTGERLQLQLRLQMMEAESAAYEVFNQFNDEPRFHISCSLQEPTGSRIQSATQLCQPEFEIQARRAHARDALESFRLWFDDVQTDKNAPVISQPAEAVISSQQQDYREKLKKVAEEHPEYLEALIKYSDLKAKYEAAK